MNEKIVIETFIEKSNKGEITLQEIPEGWKQKVLKNIASRIKSGEITLNDLHEKWQQKVDIKNLLGLKAITRNIRVYCSQII